MKHNTLMKVVFKLYKMFLINSIASLWTWDCSKIEEQKKEKKKKKFSTRSRQTSHLTTERLFQSQTLSPTSLLLHQECVSLPYRQIGKESERDRSHSGRELSAVLEGTKLLLPPALRRVFFVSKETGSEAPVFSLQLATITLLQPVTGRVEAFVISPSGLCHLSLSHYSHIDNTTFLHSAFFDVVHTFHSWSDQY